MIDKIVSIVGHIKFFLCMGKIDRYFLPEFSKSEIEKLFLFDVSPEIQIK